MDYGNSFTADKPSIVLMCDRNCTFEQQMVIGWLDQGVQSTLLHFHHCISLQKPLLLIITASVLVILELNQKCQENKSVASSSERLTTDACDR